MDEKKEKLDGGQKKRGKLSGAVFKMQILEEPTSKRPSDKKDK